MDRKKSYESRPLSAQRVHSALPLTRRHVFSFSPMKPTGQGVLDRSLHTF